MTQIEHAGVGASIDNYLAAPGSTPSVVGSPAIQRGQRAHAPHLFVSFVQRPCYS